MAISTKISMGSKIECLGRTFENDEERRKCFTDLLREGLEELRSALKGVPFVTPQEAVAKMKSIQKWPMGDDERISELANAMKEASRKEPYKDLWELWKDQVGFPHGEIEDILKLSDPPYYTACPNPFIGDFIKCHGKPYDPSSDDYHKEPFAYDVSEGKNDPIYNAHSYHTKVPHRAIMHYILHYTEPGDIVFDGFCGTGMTGVAAQMCGDKATVESLGYRVEKDGTILRPETDEEGKTVWRPFSKLGARKAILIDLSPVATFIAYNYNTPVDVSAFEREARRILKEVEDEWGWMYKTPVSTVASKEKIEELSKAIKLLRTPDEIRQKLLACGLQLGTINYTVWSDVFMCPDCGSQIVFWDAAVDKNAGKVLDVFPCPSCNTELTKRKMERAWVTRLDKAIGQQIRQAKQIPVLINYTFGGKRYEKTPDAFDIALIEKIEELDIPYWVPTFPMMFKGEQWGDTWRAGVHAGLTHVHHFYTKRNLWVLGASFQHRRHLNTNLLGLWITASLIRTTKMYKFTMDRKMGNVIGTLYVPSLWTENTTLKLLNYKISSLTSLTFSPDNHGIVENASATRSSMGATSFIDYIFTDPPFGGNIMYSELNFLWEAWLRVFTNNKQEAIENETQGKGLFEYQELMTHCFREYYRVLKPGRWMTVVFHNSKNSVWNAIQEALQKAGFVIADVRTMDKQQHTFNQVMTSGAVKQDLIISCYKPNGGLEESFKLKAGTEEGVWDFVRTHLKQLPVFVSTKGEAEVIAERQNYLLFDRMVAFHIQRGVSVPMSAAEFYAGLSQRFPERDGMYFLPEQVTEYEQKRMKTRQLRQLTISVLDESSAIQWLRQQLKNKPQTFQELHPQFMKQIGGWLRHERPLELREILEQNFLCYEGKGPIPAQIVSWLKQSEPMRNQIAEELATGKAKEENGNLLTENPEVLKKAKDRWYVPDPNRLSDLERLREKALLKEFQDYVNSQQRRLKIFRLEAMRAGFKKAWQEKDYATIVQVAKKIPENVLQEDPKLLMWYDQALTRLGE